MTPESADITFSTSQFIGPESADISAQLGMSPHRGWYSRGYLPHRDHPGLLQVITYRLADSLPPNALARLSTEMRLLQPEKRTDERRKRLETWLDAGHGSCLLRVPAAAALVVENWLRFAGVRYDLIAWVVMPNHVHVFIRVYMGFALGQIVQSWKSYTGRRLRQLITGHSDMQAAGSVWMRDYWDRFIRDERHFEMAINYIHQNPVKAGLAACEDDWPWSSARTFGR